MSTPIVTDRSAAALIARFLKARGAVMQQADVIVTLGRMLDVVVANIGNWAIEARNPLETHGKVVGTRLQFADHAAMARAVGARGERVEDPLEAIVRAERILKGAGTGEPSSRPTGPAHRRRVAAHPRGRDTVLRAAHEVPARRSQASAL